MAEKDQDLDQDQTLAPVPPPKETPFPKPESAGTDPRRSSRITAPPEAMMPSATPLLARDGGDPRRSSRITAPPEATAPSAPAESNPQRTSRIAELGAGVEESGTVAAPGAVPKTIRMVRPPATPGTAVSPPTPGGHPLPPGPKPLSPPQMQAAKSKTSRISLEAAIGAESTPHSPSLANPAGAPKTIRLKRPSEMPTLKVPAVRPPTAGAAAGFAGAHTNAPSTPHGSGSKTARVTEPEGMSTLSTPTGESVVPLTQKRTIRVKRPGAVSAEARAAAEESQDESTLTPLSPAEAMGKADDSCNPVFMIAAAATIIVTGVLTFMFYQQLYGPAAFY